MQPVDLAKELVATALRISPEDVSSEAMMGELLGWDSLGHVEIITAIEDRLGRMLEPQEAVSVRSVADIAALLTQKRSP